MTIGIQVLTLTSKPLAGPVVNTHCGGCVRLAAFLPKGEMWNSRAHSGARWRAAISRSCSITIVVLPWYQCVIVWSMYQQGSVDSQKFANGPSVAKRKRIKDW
eukprot:2934399-Amphidinium_carterae.2